MADDGINDVFYNHILNKGEPLVLRFKNFGNSVAKIYAKHFMLFREYIIPQDPIDLSKEIMRYMYYDFKDANNFPEILYQLPFDELINKKTYRKRCFFIIKSFRWRGFRSTIKFLSFIIT